MLSFGVNLTNFIPPFNEFNNDTLDALVATDFGMISSEGFVDFEPHFIADGVLRSSQWGWFASLWLTI